MLLILLVEQFGYTAALTTTKKETRKVYSDKIPTPQQDTAIHAGQVYLCLHSTHEREAPMACPAQPHPQPPYLCHHV
jgi:hypothetical protein